MEIKEFADKYKNVPKVIIPELTVGSVVFLITEHSQYTLEIKDPSTAKVIASGGYFERRKKEPCETYIIGSTMGGSMLFKHQLIEGLFCEFDNNVISSTIKKIYVEFNN